MECVQARGESISTERERWAFSYQVDGDLRFISHHDTLRLFERALARASLPVKYTEGFNPHPRLSIPLPRPVGLASCAETIVVEFEAPVDGEEVLRALNRQMPKGIEMTGGRRLALGERLHPVLVRYRLELDEVGIEDVERRVHELLERQVVQVERVNGKSGQTWIIDAKPFLEGLRIDGKTLEFSLRVTQQGTIKPAEVAGLLGYDVRSINHRIRRLEVKWH